MTTKKLSRRIDQGPSYFEIKGPGIDSWAISLFLGAMVGFIIKMMFFGPHPSPFAGAFFLLFAGTFFFGTTVAPLINERWSVEGFELLRTFSLGPLRWQQRMQRRDLSGVRRLDRRQFSVGLRQGARKHVSGLGIGKEDAEALVAWLGTQGSRALELNAAEMKQVQRVQFLDHEEEENLRAMHKVFGGDDEDDDEEERALKDRTLEVEEDLDDRRVDVEIKGKKFNALLAFRAFFVAGIVWSFVGPWVFGNDPAFQKMTHWLGRPIRWAFNVCLLMYFLVMLRMFLPGLRKKEIPAKFQAWGAPLMVAAGSLAAAGVGAALGGMFAQIVR